MGKKSKATGTKQEEDLPQWHSALPKATVENVMELPQVDHGWICTLIKSDKKQKFGILAILDITNRVRGEGMHARFMNIGPCPNPKTKGEDIAKALFATMIQPQPAPKNDDPDYFAPRRPAWILLEKDLKPCLEVVREKLEEAKVVVKLNTPEALSADNDETEDSRGRTATWELGYTIGATAVNVVKLPKKESEIWRCSITMLEDEDSGAKECFLALEDITEGTDEESSYPLGVGPCPSPTVNPDSMVRAIFATMLAPRAKEGGHSGDARRPGRLILDKYLEPWLEHVQSKLDTVDVTVEC